MWASASTKRVDRVVDPYETQDVMCGRGRRLCLPVCFYVSLRAPERGVAISKCRPINFPGPMWTSAPTKRVDRVVGPYELHAVIFGRGRRLCLSVCFYVSLRAPERGVAISKCPTINFPGPMWAPAPTGGSTGSSTPTNCKMSCVVGADDSVCPFAFMCHCEPLKGAWQSRNAELLIFPGRCGHRPLQGGSTGSSAHTMLV